MKLTRRSFLIGASAASALAATSVSVTALARSTSVLVLPEDMPVPKHFTVRYDVMLTDQLLAEEPERFTYTQAELMSMLKLRAKRELDRLPGTLHWRERPNIIYDRYFDTDAYHLIGRARFTIMPYELEFPVPVFAH